MLKPPFLQPGDKVALVSPAGNVAAASIEPSVKIIEDWGLCPVVGKNALSKYGYFAGTDEQRLEDMQWALDSEEIQAIFCTRGGYGCMRIAEELDYSMFQGNPKWLVGFSDITVFHSKLNTLGIESIHAAMPNSYSTTSPQALERLKKFLFGEISGYTLPAHPFNREGIVEAELTGGNLTLLHCLRSTPLECRHQSPILFIEDVGENLYAIDRMLQSLKLSDKFARLQGMIVGSFNHMQGTDFGKNAYEIVQETIAAYDFPVCFGFPAGHTAENYPLLLGSTIELDVNPEGTEIKFL